MGTEQSILDSSVLCIDSLLRNCEVVLKIMHRNFTSIWISRASHAVMIICTSVLKSWCNQLGNRISDALGAPIGGYD